MELIFSTENNIIKELESLVEDLNLAIESANETLPQDLTPDLDDIFNEVS